MTESSTNEARNPSLPRVRSMRNFLALEIFLLVSGIALFVWLYLPMYLSAVAERQFVESRTEYTARLMTGFEEDLKRADPQTVRAKATIWANHPEIAYVVVEDVFTTDMAAFLEVSGGYRDEIYKTSFPTGSWLEVKGLALPEFMIEIELEAYSSQ